MVPALNEGGTPAEDELAVLVGRLRDELNRTTPAPTRGPVQLAARQEAERLWLVSAGAPVGEGGGLRGWLRRSVFIPVKLAVRKLVQWYVEPALFSQRAFNQATLRLIDELADRVAELEAELAKTRARPDRLERE
jgi:hypothetical protein